MTATRPVYATREEVKAAADFKLTARNDAQIDRACESATDSVEGLLHRVFYPQLATRYFDWPNFQYAYPWRYWLDNKEIADITNPVPVVTTGGTVVPTADLIWRPENSAPPFTYLELNRSTNAGFGAGPTPQQDVAITATYGYWLKTTPGGALAAAVNDTTGTSVTVTNSIGAGVGDLVTIDSERMLVTDKAMANTGLTQQGTGCGAANNADVALALGTGNGSKVFVGETLLLDSERMLIVDIAGDTATVKRAWDGSVLATHTAASIYAPRTWSVQRGATGTTAATHLNSAPIVRALYPGLVKELAVGEALVEVRQQIGAYAAAQGTGSATQKNIGQGLDDVRDRCYARFGRKARIRTA